MRRPVKILVAAWAVALPALMAGMIHVRSRYPYGWSHCCDKALFNELRRYAQEHDGWYPAGAACPEASLSLLGEQEADIDYMANLLRGKTVPTDVVKAILQHGDRLGPDTCGWHYIEGLREKDNPKVALFWDKAGLGHNGESLDGGHVVWFVNGQQEYIPAADWQTFLQEQERLVKYVRTQRRRIEPGKP